jgi:hypothetical protein
MPNPDVFSYQPPNDATAPRYERIVAAEAACGSAIFAALTVADGPIAGRFRAVNDACKAFYAEIVAVCPASADRSAAERCVRLARMAANEALSKPGTADKSREIAKEQLLFARWQASAAVALALPSELPELG